MNRVFSRSYLVVFAGCLLAIGANRQGEFFPLAEGWSWSYTAANDNAIISTVDGQQVVQGAPTITMTNVVSGEVNETVENYWTANADGDVYLHGFTNPSLQLSYNPALLYIDEPLVVGKQWSTLTQRYEDLDGTTPFGDPVTITFEVKALEDRTVAAGTFTAYGVGQVVAVQMLINDRSYSALGHSQVASTEDTYDWYAAGVGPIQRYAGLKVYSLSEWTDPAVPVQHTTWGDIKARFHGGGDPSN